MLHSGIYDELRTNVNTASILAEVAPNLSRIFNGTVPQKKPGSRPYMPCVVYNLRSVDRQQVYCGTSGLVRSTIMLDSYATTYEGAKTLARAVRLALIDYSGMLGGTVDVRNAALQTEFDVNDNEPGLYRVSQTWIIWHAE